MALPTSPPESLERRDAHRCLNFFLRREAKAPKRKALHSLANVPKSWPLARLTIPLSAASKHLERLLEGCCNEIYVRNTNPDLQLHFVRKFAKDLVVVLAFHLAETIAALFRHVLHHPSKVLYDPETEPLFLPLFWFYPIYREMLNSASLLQPLAGFPSASRPVQFAPTWWDPSHCFGKRRKKKKLNWASRHRPSKSMELRRAASGLVKVICRTEESRPNGRGKKPGKPIFFLLYAAWVRSRAERPSVSYSKVVMGVAWTGHNLQFTKTN